MTTLPAYQASRDSKCCHLATVPWPRIMVDTNLRPRPDFGTFLQSDTTGDADGLAFYRHKASLRKNKVSILQKKREEDVSEKVRALEDYRRSLAHPNIDKAVGGHGNRTRHWTEPEYVPRPMERKVKSAGLRRNMSWNHNTVGETQEKTRPKTAEAICGDATHPQRTIFPKIGLWGAVYCNDVHRHLCFFKISIHLPRPLVYVHTHHHLQTHPPSHTDTPATHLSVS